ncbi:glycosyltransferase [Lactococcus fujiensis]|uniref:Beta-1,3-N-acetylglucosaminyltransferase n=1 Tax=Lactococcus fujiensis JCM 16395 TaxID=1291764 RepID=A0A2A5RLG1_9LACT|nr:glycosyltransferase [Lactococcus fujiensis]PCS00110.1 beta-1,3-N-acetylglucosaminyltransferase [Lactococcus fujiensis JCM 16395]
MLDKVSVVITCYNHEAYIEQCLRSVFNQTYSNIELIVFNDGSTDQSGHVIERLLKESPFAETSYFSQENRGIVAVRNEALTKITGDYLLFIDSDNYIDVQHIEILVHSLQKSNADIAYCQLWDFVHDRHVLRDDLDFKLEKELEGNLIDMSSLVRVSKVSNVRFDEQLDHKALEDYDFWLALILKNQAKPIFVKETKLNYRVLDNSRTERGNWDKYYDAYFYLLEKYHAIIPDEILKASQANIKLWLKSYLENNEKLTEANQKIQEKDSHISNFQKEVKTLKNLLSAKEEELNSFEKELDEKNRELEAIKNTRIYKFLQKLKGN